MTLRHLLVSLVVGALFGWAMSTKFPTYPSVLGGVTAAGFMVGSLAFVEHSERRALSRRVETPEKDEA
jgi:hypothetical protein